MKRKKTRLVNLNRTPCDVRITRPGPWGNPFIIGIHGTRKEVVAKYRAWLPTQPHLMARLRELKGKRLGCACRMKPCHGEVLVEMAEALPD